MNETVVINPAAVAEAIYRLSVMPLKGENLQGEYVDYINELLAILPLEQEFHKHNGPKETDSEFMARLIKSLQDGFHWGSSPKGSWYWVSLHYDLLSKFASTFRPA